MMSVAVSNLQTHNNIIPVNFFVFIADLSHQSLESVNTSLSQPSLAINDTVKVKRTKARVSGEEKYASEKQHVSLDSLKNVS